MKFKFLHKVHFNSHPRTMSTPQSSSQHAAPAQEPKIQGLQINMGLFIHPKFPNIPWNPPQVTFTLLEAKKGCKIVIDKV
jgi:hypothetical protein